MAAATPTAEDADGCVTTTDVGAIVVPEGHRAMDDLAQGLTDGRVAHDEAIPGRAPVDSDVAAMLNEAAAHDQAALERELAWVFARIQSNHTTAGGLANSDTGDGGFVGGR